MSKFIFVSGSYDPYPKANAQCAKAIEEKLKEQGHEVIYIVTRNNIFQNTIENINGNKIHFIPKPINEIHLSFTKVIDSFTVFSSEKIILYINHILIKIFFKISAFLSFKTSRNRAIEIYHNHFIRVLERVINKESPDYILTFSVPFSSHLYSLEVLNKINHPPKWFAFLIDAHKHKAGISKKEYHLFEKQENIVFKQADGIFFLDVLKKDYDTIKNVDFNHKLYFFKLPFFKIPLYDFEKISLEKKNKKDWIDITYAGTLYDDNRPVDYLIKFIKTCGNEVRFHFIGKFYPKVFNTLSKLSMDNPEKVKIYGFKDKKFVMNFLQKSDILLNIGNNNSNQIPSKILEYIGLLKPVFSFIRKKDDAALEYLTKYPYSFIIDENSDTPITEIVDNAMKFYKTYKNNKISVNNIKNQFKGYLQDDVTNQIVKILIKKTNE